MTGDRAPTAHPYLGGDFEVRRSYHGMQDGRLRRIRPFLGDADAGAVQAHDEFRAIILQDSYTCVAARSAVRRGDYRFGRYAAMGSQPAAESLAADLTEFIDEFPIRADRFASFVASFDGPLPTSELGFEDLLWQQLQLLHDIDTLHFDWDPSVSDNPSERAFSFSLAGRAFFIVGMHAASSRWSRRLAWPTLVFNAHAQFDILRDTGRIGRMKDINRTRDRRLQGSHNPSLDRFEREPETIMYSGRLVETDWMCPLRVHQPDGVSR
jgi:uncharacterized protein